jgi:murein DD-endopeptidase MepM/ murein hydrolase activator NlpD
LERFVPRQEDTGEFISQVKQKPHRQKGFTAHRGYSAEKNSPQERVPREFSPRMKAPISLAFSLPLLPAAGFCMLLVGAILTLANRESISLAWIHRDVIPSEGSSADYDMALYTGIVPQTAGQAAAIPDAQAAAAVNEGFPPGNTGTINLAAAPETMAVPETAPEEDIPLDLAETFAWKNYTVQKGDSVSKIAATHSLSMDAVIASNDLTNARLLRVGETLRLPNMDGIPYKVKSGDSLSKISKSMGVPIDAIMNANDIQRDFIKTGETIFIPGARMRTEDLKLALGELFIYPVSGSRLTSSYGWRNDPISGVRRHHAAIDLAAPTGTLVKAALDGTVATTGYSGTYGNYIILSHGDNYQTMYAHLSQISVKKDDRVKQGEKIGEVGSTGYSTGPHLHFAVYKNGQAVNPLDYLHP